MNELIEQLKRVNNFEQLNNIDDVDPNTLLLRTIQADRYDLLKNTKIKLNVNNEKSYTELIDYLLSDEYNLYKMYRNDFSFSKEELDSIFKIVYQKYQNTYNFDIFLEAFFKNKEEKNNFVSEHEHFFRDYLRKYKKGVSHTLKECDSFIKLIIEEKQINLISNVEEYSKSNLKLLTSIIDEKNELPYYLGTARYAKRIFELKDNLESDEFYKLLTLLKDKRMYNTKERSSDFINFDILVEENIDYLINVVDQSKSIPKCLIESTNFRDGCIKKNRFDLAVKCIIPKNIFENETLIDNYCKELNISHKDFYEREKWILEYYKKNNNIFNSLVGTSLQDDIFNINKEHYERFINDVQMQIYIEKLDKKELMILGKILNIYNYQEYDISSMIVNVVKNIKDYSQLTNSIELQSMSEKDLRTLVGILQLPNNQFQINNISNLQNYSQIKKTYASINYDPNNISKGKDNLLKSIYNISLTEAEYINTKYCYGDQKNNILDTLKESELPENIYNQLQLVNEITECNNQEKMSELYNKLKDADIYNSEIPFETYLKSKYTELYDKSLYKINEQSKIYGPKDNITSQALYNGHNVQICIPRQNFNFLVHCIGSCSLESDITDTNYRNDWLNRPQLQDHFVACSYINEKGIYSIRSQGKIILGFNHLEGGSILAMGNSDIDSLECSNEYNGSRKVQELNKNRAKFFVPSEMLKTINDTYNEIIVERRDTSISQKNEIKRKPDYIIMMSESMNQSNFNHLEDLYQDKLSFISDEDKETIKKLGDTKKIKEIITKYKDIMPKSDNILNEEKNDPENKYVDLIMKSKYYEDCLKAASEFNIPLVIVDKTHYFNKMLYESAMYDSKTTNDIATFYSNAKESKKEAMFNNAAKGKDVKDFLKQPTRDSEKIII